MTYSALRSFQRVSFLLLPVVQQHVLVMGQPGGTSKGVSPGSGVELRRVWPAEIPPWSGLRQLSCGRQSRWMWGMWRRLHFHHAVVPALSPARDTPVYAAQRQADQGTGHVPNNCYNLYRHYHLHGTCHFMPHKGKLTKVLGVCLILIK